VAAEAVLRPGEGVCATRLVAFSWVRRNKVLHLTARFARRR
jgi:hypothetical protein